MKIPPQLRPDKLVERDRYELRAKDILANSNDFAFKDIEVIPRVLRAPYVCYEQLLKSTIKQQHRVLEIGAGTGMHTGSLLDTGADVWATDISENSLTVLSGRYKDANNLHTKIADMEALPFDDGVFDFVVSAGSMSYGDTQKVLQEIVRVLKAGGTFVCVDSLGHNPIYRLNRWFHFLRGRRTRSTLDRMPTLKTIGLYSEHFDCVDAKFFGVISWVAPLLVKVFGQDKAANLSDWVDGVVATKRSAFKFVMMASGRK